MEQQASKTAINILIVLSILLIAASLVTNYTKKPAPVVPEVVTQAETVKPEETVAVVTTITEATSSLMVATTTGTTTITAPGFTDKKWVWSSKTIKDAKKSTAFSVTFKADGTLSGTTDCNTFFGSYKMDTNKLSFGQFGLTKMFCEGTQENEFLAELEKVTMFSIDMNKNLILMSGTTTMTFK
jgi:heat shock protein HslJ